MIEVLDSSSKERRSNIFAEMSNVSILDIMCLKGIVNIAVKGKHKFSLIDYTYEMLANYWNTDFSKVEQTSEIKLFNEVKRALMHKYGLAMEASKLNVIQILKYTNDKQINLKLLGIVKKSLNFIKKPIDEQRIGSESLNYWNNYFINEWDCNKPFLKIKKQKEVIINNKWINYINNNQDILSKYCSESSVTLLNGEPLVVEKHQSSKKDFSILQRLEKRMKFHQILDKKSYSCLEEAYEWTNMTSEKYSKYKTDYDNYLSIHGINKAIQEYPFVTTLIVIYTAIYRYNDEDSIGGYWPEFFGESNYQYKDALLAMKVLIRVVNMYKIDTKNRHYLEKRNLSEIFSQIYIPESSNRKIYSAIYKYYYRYSNKQHIVNVYEFLEDNMYRLDKHGIFFLSKDNIIDDSFSKIIELFNACLDNKGNIETIDYLPKRFLASYERWLETDKVEIDSQKEEYYIASPKVRFDIPNEKIFLSLPEQRSKIYSDERCGWIISLDDSTKKFIDGKIIKRKEGIYIVLDEEIELGYYKNLQIEYIFNNNVVNRWQFENNEPFILFNEYGNYLKSERISRSKFVIGIKNAEPVDKYKLIDKFALKRWTGYTFFYFDLEDTNEQQLKFNNIANIKESIAFEIDDRPSIKRSSYKLAFEKWEVSSSNFDSTSVYEYIGIFSFYVPNIVQEDIEVNIRPLADDITFDPSSCYVKRKTGSNIVELDFSREKLPNGYYSLSIRYKDKTIHREKFILIDPIIFIDGFDMSYKKINHKHEKLIVRKNSKYELEPSHITCLVSEDDINYYIEPSNISEAKFNLIVQGITLPIVKVILPISWNITGLEFIMDIKNTNQTKEITKQVFNDNDIRLQVKNSDYRYKTLTYKIKISDKNSNRSITEIKKLDYGGQFSFLFNSIKDRTMDFSNMVIKLFVLTEEQEILYEQVLLKVIKKIILLNYKTEFDKTNLIISWDEKYFNKSRILKLYNYTNPWKDTINFNLEDGVTQVEVPLEEMNFGDYIPVLDYKKDYGLFDIVQEKSTFFKQNELNNIIINDLGLAQEKDDKVLARLIQHYSEGKTEDIQIMNNLCNLEFLSINKVFMTIIQMKYFINNQNQNQIDIFIKHSFELIDYIINRDGFENILNCLFDFEDKFSYDDISLCITIMLAARRNKNLSNESIDKISEVNVIEALCCVKNGSGAITNNLKSKCVSSFEKKLLLIARQYKKIISIMKDEIETINLFWSWLTEYKNNYILKKNLTLSKAFRIYEFEKDISTLKVNGNKIDDLVEDIKCSKNILDFTLLKSWLPSYGITKDQFDSLKDFFSMNINENYRSLLIAALLSVVPININSDKDYYRIILTEYFGNQWMLFERYRAYLKLIFI